MKPFVLERKPNERATELRWLIPQISSVEQIHRLVVDAVQYEFRMRSNEQRFVRPRQVAIWLMTQAISCSLPQIARFYNLHHTTVLYSRRAIERERKRNADLAHDTDILLERIRLLKLNPPDASKRGA